MRAYLTGGPLGGNTVELPDDASAAHLVATAPAEPHGPGHPELAPRAEMHRYLRRWPVVPPGHLAVDAVFGWAGTIDAPLPRPRRSRVRRALHELRSAS